MIALIINNEIWDKRFLFIDLFTKIINNNLFSQVQI